MLDLCFDHSVKGALRCAQGCGNWLGGTVSCALYGKEKATRPRQSAFLKEAKSPPLEAEKQAVPLGGRMEDAAALAFHFSCGDIAAPLELGECPRKQLIFEILTADPHGDIAEAMSCAGEYWRNSMADLEKLLTRAAKREAVRLWADSWPDSACGVLFTANLLRDAGCEIIVVPLPPQRKDSERAAYCGWGDVPPGLYGTFLENAVTLTEKQLTFLSEQWRNLQAENAPLRIVKNGMVVSAAEDCYDDIIREEYPIRTCRVSDLICKVLARRLGIGDWLIAKRIQALILGGELRIYRDDPKRFYNTVITC